MMDRALVARELLLAARELTGGVEVMDLATEAKAAKLKGKVKDFAKDIGKFKGALNEFVKEMMGEVDNPRSMAHFPHMRAVLQMAQDMKGRNGVLAIPFLNDNELQAMLLKVMCEDRGTC
jgi:hypothetical protein